MVNKKPTVTDLAQAWLLTQRRMSRIESSAERTEAHFGRLEKAAHEERASENARLKAELAKAKQTVERLHEKIVWQQNVLCEIMKASLSAMPAPPVG